MRKGCVWYTDSRLNPEIREAVQSQLNRARGESPLVAVLCLPVGWFPGEPPDVTNICLHKPPSQLTMFRQILTGLEALDADVAFLTEHDVLYDASHFQFTPPRQDIFYYNANVWKVRASDGHALHYPCNQVSGLCANRELLIEHYRKRVARVEAHGFSMKMGYEPGTHRRPERVDDYGCESWMSAIPNIDIRHDTNLSPSRWRKDEFRNQRYTEGWTESREIPGWGVTKGRFAEFLADLGKVAV